MATDGCWQVKRKPPTRVLRDGGVGRQRGDNQRKKPLHRAKREQRRGWWQGEGWLVTKETPPLAFRATEGGGRQRWWLVIKEPVGNGLCKDSVSLIIKSIKRNGGVPCTPAACRLLQPPFPPFRRVTVVVVVIVVVVVVFVTFSCRV